FLPSKIFRKSGKTSLPLTPTGTPRSNASWISGLEQSPAFRGSFLFGHSRYSREAAFSRSLTSNSKPFVASCLRGPLRRFLAPVIFLILFCLSGPHFAVAQALSIPQGTYSGTLQAGEAQLHLLLHLSKNTNGSLRATLDSLEQGVFAIEATSVAFSNSTLKLEVVSVGAHFEGKVSPDQQNIDGEWSQGKASLPLKFRRETGAVARKPGDAIFPVEGLWQGAVETHGMRLRFQLHVSHDTEGHLIAALDSLDQA